MGAILLHMWSAWRTGETLTARGTPARVTSRHRHACRARARRDLIAIVVVAIGAPGESKFEENHGFNRSSVNIQGMSATVLNHGVKGTAFRSTLFAITHCQRLLAHSEETHLFTAIH